MKPKRLRDEAIATAQVHSGEHLAMPQSVERLPNPRTVEFPQVMLDLSGKAR